MENTIPRELYTGQSSYCSQVRDIIVHLQYSRREDGTLGRDAMKEWGVHGLSPDFFGLEFYVSRGNIDRRVKISYCPIDDSHTVMIADEFDSLLDIIRHIHKSDLVEEVDCMINRLAAAI